MAGILQQPNDPADQDEPPTAIPHSTGRHAPGGSDHATSITGQVDRLPKDRGWMDRLGEGQPSSRCKNDAPTITDTQVPTTDIQVPTSQSTTDHTYHEHSATSHTTSGPSHEGDRMGATHPAASTAAGEVDASTAEQVSTGPTHATSSAANYGEQSSGDDSSDSSSTSSGRYADFGPLATSSSRFSKPIRLVHGGIIPGSSDKETESTTPTQ